MAKIDITERDKVMLSNLPKLLKMGKFELTGEEVVAAGQVLGYVGSLIKRVEDGLSQPVVQEKKETKKKKSKKEKK